MGRLLVKVLTLANQIIRIQILYKNGTLLSDFQTLCMNYMLYFYVYLFLQATHQVLFAEKEGRGRVSVSYLDALNK